jgi:acetolactate synthase-1/3 small subunit
MTFVVEGNDKVVEQMTKHLHKLVDVIRVSDISDQNIVSRELALIKVKANVQTRSEIMQVVDIFRANIVDVATDSLIVEVSGDEEKVESLHELLKGFGVEEVMRTGTIAINRGAGSRSPRSSAHRVWGEASSV